MGVTMVLGLVAGSLTLSIIANLVFFGGSLRYLRTRRNILFNHIKEYADKRAHTLRAEINRTHPELYPTLQSIYCDLGYMVKNKIIIADHVKPCSDHKIFDFYKINEDKKDWKAE